MTLLVKDSAPAVIIVPVMSAATQHTQPKTSSRTANAVLLLNDSRQQAGQRRIKDNYNRMTIHESTKKRNLKGLFPLFK